MSFFEGEEEETSSGKSPVHAHLPQVFMALYVYFSPHLPPHSICRFLMFHWDAEELSAWFQLIQLQNMTHSMCFKKKKITFWCSSHPNEKPSHFLRAIWEMIAQSTFKICCNTINISFPLNLFIPQSCKLPALSSFYLPCYRFLFQTIVPFFISWAPTWARVQ